MMPSLPPVKTGADGCRACTHVSSAPECAAGMDSVGFGEVDELVVALVVVDREDGS